MGFSADSKSRSAARYLIALLALCMPFIAAAQNAPPGPLERASRAYLNGQNDQARALAAPLCDRGNRDACALVALLKVRGQPSPADAAAAYATAAKLCAAGSGAGCSAQGILTFDGVGTNKNPAAAYALVQKACNLGDPRGCQQQASALYYGVGVPVDRELGARLYLGACDKGNGKACNDLGWFYFSGDVFAQDYARALTIYQRGCSLEYADACRSVGFMYFRGLGVDRNYPQAIKLYVKACDGGNATACTSLPQVRKEAGDAPLAGRGTPGIGPTARQIRDALVYESTYGVTSGADALGLAQRSVDYETGLSRTSVFGFAVDVQYQVSAAACTAARTNEFVCEYDYAVSTSGFTTDARATHTFLKRDGRWRSPTLQTALIESARRNAARSSSNDRQCTVQGFGTLEGPHLADSKGLRC